MPPAARVTDMHTCPKVEPGPVPHVGGPVLPAGDPTVLIGFLPAARAGDMAICVGPPDAISQGESSVLIGGKPAARLGDPMQHGGLLVATNRTDRSGADFTLLVPLQPQSDSADALAAVTLSDTAPSA